MKTKKVFLLLDGEKPKVLPDISRYDLICVTDGAYHYLASNDIIPDIVTGDFDSFLDICTAKEIIHTPDQDFTDFEKILEILYNRSYYNIDVYGGSGGEQDHFMHHIHTALVFKEQLNIHFYDNYGEYFMSPQNLELKDVKGKIVSLIPIPLAQNIVTTGLKYPLNGEELAFGKKMGTRNKAIEDIVTITYSKGDLMVYVSRS